MPPLGTHWYALSIPSLYFALTMLAQLIELKGGETYSGHLVNCDPFMNLVLRDVTCTSKVRRTTVDLLLRLLMRCRQDGTRFWRIAECYVRGNNIKFLKMPDEIIDVVQEDIAKRQAMANQQQSNRGGRGGFQGAHSFAVFTPPLTRSEGGRGGYSRGGGRGGSYDGARSGGPDGGRGGSRGGRGGRGGQGGRHRRSGNESD